MALTQKSRSDAYDGLRSIMSEQSAEDLLAHFPARDLDEPITREVLHAEIADVHTEIAGVRTEIAGLDKRLSNQIADVRTEITDVDKRLGLTIAELPAKIASGYTRQTYVILAAITLATALLRLT